MEPTNKTLPLAKNYAGGNIAQILPCWNRIPFLRGLIHSRYSKEARNLQIQSVGMACPDYYLSR